MGTGVSPNPSPSHSIVTRIAALEGVAPTDLEPPLHDVVDPDALDRIAESESGSVSHTRELAVEFTYCGHRVRVDGTGTVEVTASNRPTDAGGDSTEESHGD